jgi:uncharacterized BrkB/YihY/UPF0761 family membrane protein
MITIFTMIIINLFLVIWLILAIVGRILLCFRNDYERISSDIYRIKSSGIIKWSTFQLVALLFLPFSIMYSINNIKNKNK